MEKFCLKWNDFQANASRSFKFLRKENDFYDLSSLIKTVPPRSATIFLYTERYNEDAIIGRTMSGEASKVGIRDLSWRYPII